MKKTMMIICMLIFSSSQVKAQGYDFYFFGINTKMIKEADYKLVVAGALTSITVHLAAHYAYAGINGMSIRQDGINEYVHNGSDRNYREFAQVGFIAESLGGLILTSIPATRQSDFTKGYVLATAVRLATYPIVYNDGIGGDFNFSEKYGGSVGLEYTGFAAIAVHNVMRINWKKGE